MRVILHHKKILAFIILSVTGFIVYGNSLDNDLVWDSRLTVKNELIHDLNFESIPGFFTKPASSESGRLGLYWRPVTLLSYAVDYSRWGTDPFGYHLTNVILHIFAAWAVFLLIRKIIGTQRDRNADKACDRQLNDNSPYRLAESGVLPAFTQALLISLIFLVHPLQTEAVTYIAGRADPLSLVFSVASVLLYLDARRRSAESGFPGNGFGGWRYLGCLAFFLLGLLTREHIIILPVLFLLLEIFVVRDRTRQRTVRNAIRFLLPVFSVSLVYAVLRFTFMNAGGDAPFFPYDAAYDRDVLVRVYTLAWVMLRYMRLLFVPLGLHMAPEVPVITTALSWPVAGFTILAIAATAISLHTFRKNKLVSFGLLWFIVILFPHYNLWPIQRPMYEHWVYLPMVGFWLAIVSLLDYCGRKIPGPQKAIRTSMTVILVFFIAGLSVLTIMRNNEWQNEIVFYENNLRHTPHSAIQYNNLGSAYARAGRKEEAVLAYEQAIALDGALPEVHYNLGLALRDLDRSGESIAGFLQAIELNPEFRLAFDDLATTYRERGEFRQAENIENIIRAKFKD